MPKAAKDKKMFLRGQFSPATMDVDKRTVDVVFATDTPVLRYSWRREEYYQEILDMAGANLERASKGLPVLNDHSRWEGLEGILGRAENLRMENGVWVATVRFSERDDNNWLVNDVRNGIITDISFGYLVDEVERMEMQEGEEYRRYMVRKWTPTEISFVTIPADPKAGVRSESDLDIPAMLGENRENQIPPATPPANKESNFVNKHRMKREQMVAYLSKRNISVAADATDEEVRSAFERALETDTAPDAEKIRSEAVTAERNRVTDITAAVRKAGLPDAEAEDMIKRGISIDAARAEIIDKWEQNDPNKGASGANRSVSVGVEQSEKVRKIAGHALALRTNPGFEKELKTEEIEAAREFRGMNMLRLAEEFITQSGVSTRGWSSRQIAQAALGIGSRGYHATTDFPILLGAEFNRSLRGAYDLAPRTFMPFCRRALISDFRSVSRAQISGLMDKFDEIAEGAEYKATTVSEGQETYQLVKYGRKIGITWESIVNDDLSAFTRLPQAFASKAAQKQSDIVYNILLNNPVMADGSALFHAADHKNYITSSGTVLSETNLDVAFQKFREQKSMEGDFLNLSPQFLIVGPKNEVKANKLTSTAFVPATQANIAQPQFTGLRVIVDPRVTDYAWFLSASPSMVDTIEYAFLDGEPELFTEQREGFDVDGLEIKARMVFAAKAIDYRGLFKNDGAAS